MCRLEKFHLPLRPKLKDWNMMTLNRKWMRLIVLVGCAALTASCKQAPVAQMEAEYAVLKVALRSEERFSRNADQVPYKAALETAVANVESAKAGLATAQLTYDSKKELFAKKVVSEFDLKTAENSWLTAKAQLAQAKAQEVSARNNLSYTEVKSPADGVIGTLPYRVGALVSASLPQPLTTVSDNSDMYVYFSMTENQLLALTRQYGSKAEALKNMPEVELQLNDKSMYGEKGRIETISGVVDRNTGTASLRAVFPNKNGLLYSGTSGNVILPVTMKGSLVIPQATTFEIQDITYVYKVVDGKAQSAPVSVTRVNGGQEYIVNDGLKEGDIIVAEGVGLLREGTPVKVKQN